MDGTLRLLLADESILAVCLMDPDFNIADAASTPAIEKFKITDKVQDSAGAFAATMLGMASLIDGTRTPRHASPPARRLACRHGAGPLCQRGPGGGDGRLDA